MISTSGKTFADFQSRLDARIATIVKITHGSDVWYLGDMEIEWGAGVHVYALLTGCTGMKRVIDPFRKQWSVGEVTLNFSNLPFKRSSSGSMLRPSDDIDVVETDSVDIYLLCGENATGLSDCILHFSGMIKEPAKYDENIWSITVVDHSLSLLNKMLPDTTVGLVYSDAPEKFQNEFIPLVYGNYDHSYHYNDSIYKGLVKGYPINNDTPPKCVFADHVANISYMFNQESGIDRPSRYLSCTLNDNDNGRVTGAPNSKEVEILIPFENSNHDAYSIGIWADYGNEPVLAKLAHDGTDTTYCTAKDSKDDGATMTSLVAFGFWSDIEDTVNDLIRRTQYESVGSNRGFGFQYNIAPASGITLASTELQFWWLNYGSEDEGWNLYSATFDNTWRQTITKTNVNAVEYKGAPFAGLIKATVTGGDSVNENRDIINIKELRLRICYDSSGGDVFWGGMLGRVFGSWIDNEGRSNSYISGNLIEDSSFIVESLLRDKLNWPTSMIDEASFDAAANTSVIMRMNLTKKATVARIIRQICEQSTFAFHVNSAGKARLIPLNESSPSIDRTIPFSHIKANTLRTSQVGPFVNYLTYHSCWLPQLGKYRDVITYYDSGSWTAYGKHEHTVYWPNIEGGSCTHIFGHLLNAMDGLWSNPRDVIEFETTKFTNADIEIGDWIELDDETWDAQLKLKGVSWSGEQFLVTEVTQKQDGTRIKAVAI